MATYQTKALLVNAEQFLPDEQRWDQWPAGIHADGAGGHVIHMNGAVGPIAPKDWRVVESDGSIFFYSPREFEENYEEITSDDTMG